MKNSYFLLELLALVVLCSFLNSTNALTASQRNNKPMTREQREANVKQQLLDHQHRATLTARESKSMSSSATPSEVSVQFNKLVKTSSTIFFDDDMESGTNGWTIVSPTDSAAWHMTTRDYNSYAYSWQVSVEESWWYQTGSRVYEELISPAIDLTGTIGDVTLLFTEKYYTERGWDFCMVDVTTDGGTSWTHLRGGYGESVSGDSYGWKVSSLDITPYGNQTINLRFVFDTGDSLFNAFTGWFIDNVSVFDQSGSITGTVYFDQNRNAIYDPGELGLENWFVTVAGPVTVTFKTFDDGSYTVPLPLGSYQVSELPNSHEPRWKLTSPSPLNVDLNTPGQLSDAVNFGNYTAGCILSGMVFKDVNHNGAYNSGEPAFTDPLIELKDMNNNWIGGTHADSTGQFSFVVFKSENYCLSEYMLPTNWVSSVPEGSPPTHCFYVWYLDSTLSGFDFGSYELHMLPEHGTIRGYVFNDLNQNGIQDDQEPLLSLRDVFASDSNTEHTWAQTDTLGRFSFENLAPGRYTVGLAEWTGPRLYGWQKTIPVGNYIIQLDDGQVQDNIIFGLYHLPVGTVRGNVFYDMNRNGIQESVEHGLADKSVSIRGPDVNWSLQVFTDAAGNYEVDTVAIGSLTISVDLPKRWRSVPRGAYSINLGASEMKDSISWGAYTIVPGSISGSVYNDVDGMGTRDSGEAPLKGATIYLDGQDSSVYRPTVSASTISNDSGTFRFDGVWSGWYRLRIVMAANWRQTQPPSLQAYSIHLGDEENLTGIDFGLTYDSTFNLAFRTFLPESIAYSKDFFGHLGRPVLWKRRGSEVTFTLVTPVGGLNGLHIEFEAIVDAATLTATGFPPPMPAGSRYKWEFKMNGSDTLANGDTIMVFAHSSSSSRPIPFNIKNYWWYGSSLPEGTSPVMHTWGQGTILYPMPNLINVLQIMYTIGFGSRYGLSVGIVPGPHSVGITRYDGVFKTLVDVRGNMHTGSPNCLDDIYRRTASKYSPTLGNNILFAEALVLKASIAASDIGITPYGFGSLIFHGESTNPFNGLSVRKIAARLDTSMSAFDDNTRYHPGGDTCLCDSNYFNIAYQTIRMIDSAFSGPLDTIGQWVGGKGRDVAIFLKPVRPLSDVPFLTLDSAFSSIAADVMFHRGSFAEEPLQYKLEQNYPNPFNPTTTLSFTLVQESFVTLKIYNILGQEVATLMNREQMDEGTQEIEFNASSLPSGVYLYRIKAEVIANEENGIAAQTFFAVKKMVLLK